MIKMKLHIKLAEHRLTQTKFSKITNIRQATLSAYCNDTFKMISKEHLDKMCTFFNCTPNDLIEYIPDNPISNINNSINNKN